MININNEQTFLKIRPLLLMIYMLLFLLMFIMCIIQFNLTFFFQLISCVTQLGIVSFFFAFSFTLSLDHQIYMSHCIVFISNVLGVAKGEGYVNLN